MIVLRVDWAAWAVTEARMRRAMGPNAFLQEQPRGWRFLTYLSCKAKRDVEAERPLGQVISLAVERKKDDGYLPGLGEWARKQRSKRER